MQLLSIQLFQKVMELVVKKGKMLLKTIVSQSLSSLLIYRHNENQRVAEVRTHGLLISPWKGARCILPWCLAGSSLPLTLAQERRSCALGCGATSWLSASL